MFAQQNVEKKNGVFAYLLLIIGRLPAHSELEVENVSWSSVCTDEQLQVLSGLKPRERGYQRTKKWANSLETWWHIKFLVFFNVPAAFYYSHPSSGWSQHAFKWLVCVGFVDTFSGGDRVECAYSVLPKTITSKVAFDQLGDVYVLQHPRTSGCR